MVYHNRFDTRGASEMGSSAEQRFSKLASSRGWSVKKSTFRMNKQDKIDFVISKRGVGELSVDVKSRKRLKRQRQTSNDDIVWLEIMAVGHEHPGWLYGEAKLLAFEKDWGFLIVDREKVANYVDASVDKNTIVKTPEEAHKKIYHRKTFRGLLTWLFSSEVERFTWDRWLDETRG